MLHNSKGLKKFRIQNRSGFVYEIGLSLYTKLI